MKATLVTLTAGLVLLGAAQAHAKATLHHSDRGSFVNPASPLGGANLKNPVDPTEGENYQIRALNSGIFQVPPTLGTPFENERNYHSFDLTDVTGTIETATLRIWVEPASYDSSAPSETVELFSVSTTAAVLANPTDLESQSVFADLGSGTSYGDFLVTSANDGSYLEVVLNEDAITDLNTAIGGFWSVGGALTTIDGTYNTGLISERVFQSEAGVGRFAQLVLDGQNVVPEPASAMLLAAGGLCLLRRRSRA